MSDKQSDKVKETIQGRVAQILNERELVINIGTNRGVKRGMVFAVLAETPLQVRDPETGDVLDTIDREKIRVKATEVREKITICKTYMTYYYPAGPLYGGLAERLNAPPREEPETIEAHHSSVPEDLPFEERYVKINDRVIRVFDD